MIGFTPAASTSPSCGTRSGKVLPEGGTLAEALRAVADSAPRATSAFPGRREAVATADLLKLAEECAWALVRAGVRPGDVVGLLAPARPGLLAGLFGIALSGAAVTVLPIPVGFGDTEHHIGRLGRIVDAAAMTYLVVDARSADTARLLQRARPGLRSAPALPGHGMAAPLPSVAAGDLAVIQFTSGTTTRPRGVMLSHRAVLAGLRSILISAEFSSDDVLVQWMPHHHDMGLFGHLCQILNGGDSHVLEPVALLRRPGELLRYFASCHGTVLTGVNFAYEMLMDAATPQLLDGLDLSAWRLAFNGAEPVRPDTVRRFAELFGPAGAPLSAMYPVYGMAEATLAVSFPKPGTVPKTIDIDQEEFRTGGQIRLVSADHPHAKRVVSVGTPVAGIEMRLVDESGERLGTDTLGEIQIRGPMVTTGYLGDPAATAAVFAGAWLRTGDLGFRVGDDYYVTGRSKEMAIVHGRNYFPEDAEQVVQGLPGVYHRRAVAVAQTIGADEYIAVIAETTLTADARSGLEREIRQQVTAELGTSRIRVHLVEPRWLTRTTSGKWQRLLAADRLRERSST